MDNEIRKPEEGGAVVAFDYGKDAGAGYENQTSADTMIPFLALLQDLSPQVTGANGNPLPGAKPGLLIDTVTEEIFGDAVDFVPCTTDHCFVEWVPRKKGGGFVARHETDSDLVKEAIAAAKEFGKYSVKRSNEDGTVALNDLVETFYVFGVLSDSLTPIVVAFTSTKIKVYKKWMTKIRMFTIPAEGRKIKPPLFAHLVRVGVERQKKGENLYYNFTLAPTGKDVLSSLLAPDDERLLAAKALKDVIDAGNARIAYDTQDGAMPDGGDTPF